MRRAYPMGRWIRFGLAIGIGVALGLLYGWLISPVRYVDTSPDTLSIDYKADFVLMTAEAYAQEADLANAVRRLALLGNPSPLDQMAQAIAFAQQYGYQQEDIARMQNLYAALQAFYLAQGTPLATP